MVVMSDDDGQARNHLATNHVRLLNSSDSMFASQPTIQLNLTPIIDVLAVSSNSPFLAGIL